MISLGVAAARWRAIIAEVLSGLTSPVAAAVTPRLEFVVAIASPINWLTCGEIVAGSILRATELTSPPLMPMAAPT